MYGYHLYIDHADGRTIFGGWFKYRREAKNNGIRIVTGWGMSYRVVKAKF